MTARRDRTRRPRVEALECRELLSVTYTVTNIGDSGAGSLREAITLSNATSEPDANQIQFRIAATNDLTIALRSPLPAITRSLDIEGPSQPGYGGKPIVILNGTNAGAGADGLRFVAGGNVVRGLAISGFAPDAAGAGGRGIVLEGGQNLVQNCYLGTDATGQSAYPNRIGIEADSASNTIGGTTPNTGNVLSGNTVAGLALLGASGGSNFVQGNNIGVNVNGTGAVPNGTGVFVATSTNVIGGEGGARNLISGNTVAGAKTGAGIYFDGPAVHNLVQGNYIGLDATGESALPNNYGILYGSQFRPVPGLTGNTIGGTVNTQGNFISGNTFDGVFLGNSSDTLLEGNFIGLDAAGAPAGNGGNGVSVAVATPSPTPLALANTIGGTVAGAGNLIQNNAKAGVLVANFLGAPIVGVTIEGNYIAANGQLGIDIGGDGVTPGYLFVNSATTDAGGVVTVSGVLHGAPNATYRVDLFANQVADPSGYGQGQLYLTTTEPIVTDILGNATFAQAFNGLTPSVFTATMTDASGSTSEFSPAYPLGASASRSDLVIALAGPSGSVPAGGNVTLTATIANNGPDVANGVVLNDLLPAGLTFVSATSSVGTVAGDASGAVSANIGTLARGGTATITIVAIATQTGSLTNAAAAFSTTFDPNYANNQATQAVTILPAVPPTADLGIGQSSFAPGVGKAVGQNLVYTITVANNGPSVATGVLATDFIPAGQRFVSVASSQGFSSLANGIVTTNLGTIQVGAAATIVLTVGLDQAGTATNVANVRGDQLDTNVANNSSTVVDQVAPPAVTAPLALTQSASPAVGGVGRTQTITLIVTNPGTVPAAGVILNDALPANARFVAAATSMGTYVLVNGFVSANFGTLAPGASAALVITLVPTASGSLFNYAATLASGSPGATQTDSSQTIPVGGDGPIVTGVTAPGTGGKLSQVVLSFDTPLNAASARRTANYRVYAIGGAVRDITSRDRPIPIKMVSYNASTRQVTITLAKSMPRSQFFRVVAVGKSSAGIKDKAGHRLNGAGSPGTDFTTAFFGLS